MSDLVWGLVIGFVGGAAVTHLTWTLAHVRKIRAELEAIDSRLGSANRPRAAGSRQ